MTTTPSPSTRPRWIAPTVVGAAALVVGGMVGGMLGGAAADSTYLPQLEAASVNLETVQAQADESAAAAKDAQAQLAELGQALDDTATKLEKTSAGLATASADSARWMGAYNESVALGDDMLSAYNAQYDETQTVIGKYNQLVADYNAAVDLARSTVDEANAVIAERNAELQSLGNDFNTLFGFVQTQGAQIQQQTAQIQQQTAQIAACQAELAKWVDGANYLFGANQALIGADYPTAEAYLNLALAALTGVTGVC